LSWDRPCVLSSPRPQEPPLYLAEPSPTSARPLVPTQARQPGREPGRSCCQTVRLNTIRVCDVEHNAVLSSTALRARDGPVNGEGVSSSGGWARRIRLNIRISRPWPRAIPHSPINVCRLRAGPTGPGSTAMTSRTIDKTFACWRSCRTAIWSWTPCRDGSSSPVVLPAADSAASSWR